jgi:hypothetical protein
VPVYRFSVTIAAPAEEREHLERVVRSDEFATSYSRDLHGSFEPWDIVDQPEGSVYAATSAGCEGPNPKDAQLAVRQWLADSVPVPIEAVVATRL